MIWVVVVICLLIAFMFSGIEAGILSVNRVRLRHRLNINDPAAIKLSALLAHPERVLVTVLLVTNFMNICAILLVTQECVRAWGKSGYLYALLISLPVTLIGIELLPKSLFRRFPYRALAAFSEPMRLADLALSPLHAVGALVLRMLPRKEEKKLFVAREDFKYFTVESERQGMLTKPERELIHSVVDFRTVTARDVMVPMEKVRTIRADVRIAEVLAISRETNLDRLPVIDGNGEIAGLVNVFEILVDRVQRDSAGAYLRRIITVPPEEEAYSVIQKLRAARITLAVVRGQNGQPLGIASSEDLLNRLVKVTPGPG
jgi:CBS domain containing-hemolysin-like protein